MQFGARQHVHLQHTDFVSAILFTGVDKLHLVTCVDASVNDLEVCNYTSEGIEHRIEDERLQWSLVVTHGCRNPLHDGTQDIINTLARSSAGTDYLFALAAQQVDNLILNLLRHRVRHITFVHDRNNLKVVVYGHIQIRNGLGLNTLSGIDHEQSPLACSDGAAHLV